MPSVVFGDSRGLTSISMEYGVAVIRNRRHSQSPSFAIAVIHNSRHSQ